MSAYDRWSSRFLYTVLFIGVLYFAVVLPLQMDRERANFEAMQLAEMEQ